MYTCIHIHKTPAAKGYKSPQIFNSLGILILPLSFESLLGEPEVVIQRKIQKIENLGGEGLKSSWNM